MGSARQVAVPESRDLVHGSEQGGPDAGSGFQKAGLRLHEGGWAPGAGGALIIFCTASGPARLGRFAAIAVAFHPSG